jgi:hypothetical protein
VKDFNQVGGTHYIVMDVQPWDAMDAWMSREAFHGYLTGNCIRYLARWRNKNGLEDLQKCRHYLDKLIENIQGCGDERLIKGERNV